MMLYATSMTSVRPSVCNKKWKSAHDRIGQSLGVLCYLAAEASPDRGIVWSRILLRKRSGVWKTVEFCTLHGNNGYVQLLACRAISASTEILVHISNYPCRLIIAIRHSSPPLVLQFQTQIHYNMFRKSSSATIYDRLNYSQPPIHWAHSMAP